MEQTCIIRYNHPYYIIMTPMSPYHNAQYADLNVFHVEETAMRLIRDALNAGKSSVQLGTTVVSLANFNPHSLHSIHNLSFYHRQKTINGLVIKLVRFDWGKIVYVVSGCQQKSIDR